MLHIPLASLCPYNKNLQESPTVCLSTSRTSVNFTSIMYKVNKANVCPFLCSLKCRSATWCRKDAYRQLVMKRKACFHQLFERLRCLCRDKKLQIQSVPLLSRSCKHAGWRWNIFPMLSLYYLDTWLSAPFTIPTTMGRENGNLSGGRCCLVAVAAGKTAHHMRVQ